MIIKHMRTCNVALPHPFWYFIKHTPLWTGKRIKHRQEPRATTRMRARQQNCRHNKIQMCRFFGGLLGDRFEIRNREERPVLV